MRSKPILSHNQINNNEGIGLFIRDYSIVKLNGKNEIKNNKYFDIYKQKFAV